MQPLATLVQVVVLFGSTLAIIFADKAYRRSHPVETASGLPPAEPGAGMLILLTLLCNIAALPTYFYQTRNSGLWAVLGFIAFCVCFGASVVAGIVINILLAVAT